MTPEEMSKAKRDIIQEFAFRNVKLGDSIRYREPARDFRQCTCHECTEWVPIIIDEQMWKEIEDIRELKRMLEKGGVVIEEVFHRAMASILEELGFDPNFDSFAEMGMDSLDYVDFIVRIELRFEVRVPEGVVFEDLTELEQWMVER